MTEADRTALLDLARQLRACVPPGDRLDALWEWIGDLEACAQGQRTLLGYAPRYYLARGHALLHRRLLHRSR